MTYSIPLEVFEEDQRTEEYLKNKRAKKEETKSSVEKFAIQKIKSLIPEYNKIELVMYIDDSSYSIDFFVTNGQKKQSCLDLIDEGIISNKAYEAVAETIAKYARASENYKAGSVNKYRTSETKYNKNYKEFSLFENVLFI